VHASTGGIGPIPVIAKRKALAAAFVDSELAKLATGKSEISKPSAAFQRVVQRAVTHVQSTTGREKVTAANVLVAILTERGSQAFAALERQASSVSASNKCSSAACLLLRSSGFLCSVFGRRLGQLAELLHTDYSNV